MRSVATPPWERVALGLTAAALLVASDAAGANELDPGRRAPPAFRAGVAALERGAVDEAIDSFELLADQGFVHPDASFDRAVAYLERARGARARDGDLGRAAAALSETLLLRPEDEAAASALERVQQELARRRARRGNAELSVRPSLGQAVVRLLDEGTSAILALAGSLALTLGMASRRLFQKPAVRLGGAIALGLGASALIVGSALTYGARSDRLRSRPAVVIAPEAPLLDENAVPRKLDASRATASPASEPRAVPEGAEVRMLETRGALARISWGSVGAWVLRGQLRVLKTPDKELTLRAD